MSVLSEHLQCHGSEGSVCAQLQLLQFREDGTVKRTLREAALVWGVARGLRWVHLLILAPVWICFQPFIIIYFLNKLHCACECMCVCAHVSACVCILLGIKLRTLLILGKHSTIVACDQPEPCSGFLCIHKHVSVGEETGGH